jgi:glycosyltransferase involved in cell wall biosynthesis
MRIGFDVAQTCTPRAGCGWAADLLVRAIAEVAPEHDLYLYHHFGTWLNPDTSRGTHLSNGNTAEPLARLSVKAARELWTTVESGECQLPGDPDIVHANSYQAPKVGTAKLVYTVYDMSFWTYPEFTTEENRLVCQRGTLDAVSRAAGLVFISESARREFDSLFPGLCEKRGITTKVALLGSRFPNVESSRDLIGGGNWLAIGSLEPRKNYEGLLDAFDCYWIKSKRKRKLTIAGGSGWKSQSLQQRIKEMEARGMVKYVGYIDDAELKRLYRDSLALLFPSHYEGFGLPVVEAMSQGCPVITRRNTSLPEVGGLAAIYYNDTSEDLAERMLKLEIDSDFYLERSALALRQARQFDWKITARNVLELYDEVLASRSRNLQD